MPARFRTSRDTTKAPASPEALFRELRPTDRAIRDLLSRQADVLREYEDLDSVLKDVALELPTGAGKTLVGLLLADFRRRAYGDRAAYLCPTIQLARQVARKGVGYGLPVVCLTGPQRDYDPAEWSRYVRGQAVTITTYSALFNTNPRIDNAETLILDDAHAGEGYVSSLWSLSVLRDRDSLYAPLLTALKGGLSRGFAGRLSDLTTMAAFEAAEVELVAPPIVFDQADVLREAIIAHTAETDDPNHWAARMLVGQVEHCLVYASWREILVRPLIPPTAHHSAFADANQRIYMSATLGAGGELERAFGVPKIHRLAVPVGAEKQGLGRRFFLFPGASQSADATDAFVRNAIADVGRAVVIAPSNRELDQFEQRCLPDDVETITAPEVEGGFDAFVEEDRAALTLANRYDGLDLPDDVCRLVVLSGLPAYSHLQERFLLDRLRAGRVTAERVRTRVTQGAGRCTRNAKDYAAVIIHGDRLVEFCSRDEEVAAMLPELQAEIEFGLKNSESGDDLMELLRLFLAQDDEWAEADDDIRAQTNERARVMPPGAEELQRSVAFEVRAWQAIWRGDVAKAVELAQTAADALDGEEELRGYRAVWLYLAACWAGELAADGDEDAATVAASLRTEAEREARMLPWFPRFRGGADRVVGTEFDARAARAAATLRGYALRGRKFESEMREFERQLAGDEATAFELGLETLGKLLGFESIRRTDTAAPDCAWRDRDEIWFVFEAKTEEKPENLISTKQVRQALTHPTWVRKNLGWEEPAETVNMLVTYKEDVESAAATLAEQLRVVDPGVIRALGAKAVELHREVRGHARGLSEEALAAQFAYGFARAALSTNSLKSKLGRYLVAKL